MNVCHIPPGNPDDFRTLNVNARALRSHLAHGDLAGRCGDFCDTLCDDGNDCTVDACDKAEKCIRPPEAADDGTGCDDGNACTTADACAGGACIGGPPPICEDGDLCTAASCDSGTGCVFTPLPDSDADAVCDAIDNCPFVVNSMQEKARLRLAFHPQSHSWTHKES